MRPAPFDDHDTASSEPRVRAHQLSVTQHRRKTRESGRGGARLGIQRPVDSRAFRGAFDELFGRDRGDTQRFQCRRVTGNGTTGSGGTIQV